MKIGTRVYVSILSKSKVAGEAATVIGFSSRGEVKVKTDFGVVGYPKSRFLNELFADAPKAEDIAKSVSVNLVKPRPAGKYDYVVDNDVAHMYLTQIRPLIIKDPTDLLCKVVRFETPLDQRGVMGWVTDQWIEDGVELLNVVHAGVFTVVGRSCITHAWEPGRVNDRVGRRII